MAKVRKYSHIHQTPLFIIFMLVLISFAVVQLVRAASGGISGSPGPRYDSAQATDYVSTTSPEYAEIPNMSVHFTSTGNAPVIATISMSSPTKQFPGCGHFMRLIIDGVSQSNEVPVLLADRDIRSFTFVSDPLSPGAHTAKIEWRIQMPYFATTGCVQTRSLTVLHQ